MVINNDYFFHRNEILMTTLSGLSMSSQGGLHYPVLTEWSVGNYLCFLFLTLSFSAVLRQSDPTHPAVTI